MLKKWMINASILVSCVTLSGCFDPSQDELLSKAKGAISRAEIAAALGPADDVTSSGAMDVWRYSASDGDVCFSAVGKIALRIKCP